MKPEQSNITYSPDSTTLAALGMIEASEGEYRIRATGASMLPLFRQGDILAIQRIRTGFTPGQILVYRDGMHLFAHRILRLSGGEVRRAQTIGDNSMNADPLVSMEQWIGVVIAIQRNQRWMSLDTKAWNRVNPILSRLGLARSRLFRHEDGRNSQLRRWSQQLARMRFYLVMTFAIALFGRWRD
jgi:hypothetical protein